MPVDVLGRPFQPGQLVAHGVRDGNSGGLNIRTVVEVHEDYIVFETGRKNYAFDRMAILEKPDGS